MSCSVVCISATDGADGDQIAPLVARGLGFRLIDEQIVARAADEAGVKPHQVADVERRKSLITRVLNELPAAGLTGPATLVGPRSAVAAPGPDSDALRGLIRAAIEEIADQGDAVIVAHAASHALARKPTVLRVFITASPPTRAERIAKTRGCAAKEAQKLVGRGDSNRADYLRRFYDVSNEGPSDYDLLVNTDRLTADQAAELIISAARI